MMSGPSDFTLFSKILIFCSHDIPIGDSYYDPNLAGCWLWERPLGVEASAQKAPIKYYQSWKFGQKIPPPRPAPRRKNPPRPARGRRPAPPRASCKQKIP